MNIGLSRAEADISETLSLLNSNIICDEHRLNEVEFAEKPPGLDGMP
jgi:hypothetical protein